jgi:hypothetical protein
MAPIPGRRGGHVDGYIRPVSGEIKMIGREICGRRQWPPAQ